MKLTPLDIHHKEFRRSIRGYNEEEVDVFLDQVAEDFERLFKENIDLKEQVESMREKVKQYEGVEHTLQKALFTAQQAADEVQNNAKKESELIIKDAELKSKEIIQNIIDDKQKLKDELTRLKESEKEFRLQFKDLLKNYLKEAEVRAEEEKPAPKAEASESQPEPRKAGPESPKAEAQPRKDEPQPRRAQSQQPAAEEPRPEPVKSAAPIIEPISDAVGPAQEGAQPPAGAPPVASGPARPDHVRPDDQVKRSEPMGPTGSSDQVRAGDFGMRAPDVGSPREALGEQRPAQEPLAGAAAPAADTEFKVTLEGSEPLFEGPAIPQPQSLPEVVSSFFDDDMGIDEADDQAEPSPELSPEPSPLGDYSQPRPTDKD
jgi:cell division initiation protein